MYCSKLGMMQKIPTHKSAPARLLRKILVVVRILRWRSTTNITRKLPEMNREICQNNYWDIQDPSMQYGGNEWRWVHSYRGYWAGILAVYSRIWFSEYLKIFVIMEDERLYQTEMNSILFSNRILVEPKIDACFFTLSAHSEYLI